MGLKKLKISQKDALFLDWKDEHIHTTSWFQKKNITAQNLHKYEKEGLLRKLGGGAYVKSCDKLHWKAGVFVAQKELKLPLHVGAESALGLHSIGSDIRAGFRVCVSLFLRKKNFVPDWLRNSPWDCEFFFKYSNLFKSNIGLTEYVHSEFPLLISSKASCFLEFISQSTYEESYKFLEKNKSEFLTIRPSYLEELLIECNSLKVKKIFFRLALKLGLPIIKEINKEKVFVRKKELFI